MPIPADNVPIIDPRYRITKKLRPAGTVLGSAEKALSDELPIVTLADIESRQARYYKFDHLKKLGFDPLDVCRGAGLLFLRE